MEPKTMRELQIGDTFMLASEIMERTSVSQVYEKIGDTEIRHIGTEEARELAADEIVYPFEPTYAINQP